MTIRVSSLHSVHKARRFPSVSILHVDLGKAQKLGHLEQLQMAIHSARCHPYIANALRVSIIVFSDHEVFQADWQFLPLTSLTYAQGWVSRCTNGLLACEKVSSEKKFAENVVSVLSLFHKRRTRIGAAVTSV